MQADQMFLAIDDETTVKETECRKRFDLYRWKLTNSIETPEVQLVRDETWLQDVDFMTRRGHHAEIFNEVELAVSVLSGVDIARAIKLHTAGLLTYYCARDLCGRCGSRKDAVGDRCVDCGAERGQWFGGLTR